MLARRVLVAELRETESIAPGDCQSPYGNQNWHSDNIHTPSEFLLQPDICMTFTLQQSLLVAHVE